MEEGFSDWVKLEYLQIVRDVGQENFIISSIPPNAQIPQEFKDAGIQYTDKDITELQAVLPDFEKSRVCLLDPSAKEEFCPEDRDKFDYFAFGGILGDDPPRDRTGELRKHGFIGRRLGPVQMTTDTAVRVTKIICDEQRPLEAIDFLDHPELKFSRYESTQMPFRYVKNDKGEPIMPAGMLDLIKKDTEKSLDDLL
ncbi:protein arginine N-methyltransferase Sfm1p [Trichomonascus vanleenenianus]|uniref:protein-arginine N-methyltransferase SFM1 n=1 Tax=Trichomonascus vanleenenianus TaxID=2268995 RepID=UPI003ECA0B0F